jgi:hypothetical protein
MTDIEVARLASGEIVVSEWVRVSTATGDGAKAKSERLRLSPQGVAKLADALRDLAENADKRLRPPAEGVFKAAEIYSA